MTARRATSLASRRRPLWLAAMLHRLSGLGLALFLPFHFLVLGLAIDGEAELDGFLRWTDLPAVKLAEAGLVFLLAVHMLGGIRLLIIENFTWQGRQKPMAFAAVGVAAMVMLAFLANAF
jgi:fumarate reductase subunit D